MEFDRLLDKVTALLAERERVSFAALKEYFDLNDDQLEAVKAELVEARGVARNENDRVLVGDTDDAATEAPAERRNLTVVFVDIVGSTELAARLDPEDLREVVRSYQLTAAGAIERYDGYIAQYLGDGLLVYFGYPIAHEDDARRAVLAAWDVQRAMVNLNLRLEREHGINIALRIGVHTGLVVVGDVGAGERHEALALGKTPNVAARLEGLAKPNAILVSDATRVLLRDSFTVEPAGSHELKGIPGPTPVYRVVDKSGVTSRFDSAVTHKLLPMAGRRRELRELVTHWQRARRGSGSAVLVSGDAGIGKSRLVQALKDHVSGEDNRWVVLRASPYHRNTPLHPVLALWRQMLHIGETDEADKDLEALQENLAQYDLDQEHAVAVFAKLLQIPLADRHPAADVELRDMYVILGQIVDEFVKRGPLLMVFEDMQWADPSTQEIARQLIRRASDLPLLAVITARREFDVTSLGDISIRHLVLGRLPRADVEQMIASVAGGRLLSRPVHAEIVRRTDGVPAFVEELTRMLVASDWLREEHGELVPVGPMPSTIPATLKDALMARLDRLGDAKVVAQHAAVIGRTFPRSLLVAVLHLSGERLDRALIRLVEGSVLKRRKLRGVETFFFRHVLLQQAAYQSLLKSVRQNCHLRIATVMERDFQPLVAQQPERVAWHFQRAGAMEQAIGYWQWAGESAVERAANVEALAHLGQGMALLRELPQSSTRDQRELALLTAMGPAMVVTRGWAAPELGDIYNRAMEILAAGGHAENIDFQVLGGLCAYHLQRGELDTVYALAERLIRQSHRQQDVPALVVAHVCLAVATFYRGQFARAREHCEQVAQHYEPTLEVPVGFLYGQDPAVISDNVLATVSWISGDAAAGERYALRAQKAAEPLATPFSLCLAKAWHSRLLLERGDNDAARALAEEALTVGRQKGYRFVTALALIVIGAVQAESDSAERGAARIRDGIDLWREGGNELSLTYFYALLARAEHLAGDADAANAAIAAGLARVDQHGEYFYQSELFRLRGELLDDGQATEKRRLLERSLALASDIGAVMLKVRSARALLALNTALPRKDGEDGAGYRALSAALAEIAPGGDDRKAAAARHQLRDAPG